MNNWKMNPKKIFIPALLGILLFSACIGMLFIPTGIALLTSHNNIQPSHNHISFDYNGSLGTLDIQGIGLTHEFGISMQPTWFTRNTLIYAPYTGQELKEGDIIIYSTPNSTDTTSHRIRGVYPDHLVVQGDANDWFEDIPRENVKAVVVGVLFT